MRNTILKLFQNLSFSVSYLFKHNLNEKKILNIIEIKNGTVLDVGSNVGRSVGNNVGESVSNEY